MEKPMIPFVGTVELEGRVTIRLSADPSGIRVGTV
jgi:hypothetical protein